MACRILWQSVTKAQSVTERGKKYTFLWRNDVSLKPIVSMISAKIYTLNMSTSKEQSFVLYPLFPGNSGSIEMHRHMATYVMPQPAVSLHVFAI